LAALGFPNAMVNAGGNLAVRGRHAQRRWHIGIRDPRSDPERPALVATLECSDEAVITHGDDQRYFDHAGRRYAHLIDPRTGWPARGFRSLTVVHRDGTLADAAGAALYVAGPGGWRELAATLAIDKVLVVMDDGQVQATEPLLAQLNPAAGIELRAA
jgi:thiamine biosynthesis lipoprotein